MKIQKVCSLYLVLSLLLTFSLPGFTQEMSEEELEAKIEELGKDIEIIHVEADDPLLKLIAEAEGDGELCDTTNPVFEPNTNLKNVFSHLLKDTGSILLAPVGWDKNDWLKASFVVAGITMLSTQDAHVKKFSQSLRSDSADKFSHGLEKIGNGGSMLILLGGTYATSLVFKDQKLKNASLTAIEGVAVAAVLTSIGKKVFHRQRPTGTDDQYNFSGPGLGSSNMSFPSGHTGTAFAVATVFAEAYKDTKIIPIIAYSAASLAGLSRIYDNKHWVSDVVGGAVLGYLAGKFVADRRLNKGDNYNKIKITPSFNFGKQGGMNLSVTIPLNGKKKKKR